MHDRYVVSPDGTNIGFSVHGTGPPLVVVPGVLAPLDMYRPLVRVLAGRYTVVLVSRRGYGTSEPGPSPARFERQVEDIVAVLDEFPGPATLFGHSFGGLAGLRAAIAVPKRVARLVLYEPPLALLGDVLVPMLRHCRKAVAEGRPQDAVRTALTVSGSPRMRDEGPADTTLARLTPLVPGLIVDLECTTEMVMPVDYWAGLTAPLTVFQGEHATAEYARSVEILRERYPHARYEVLPDEAHFPRDMTPLAKVFTG